MKGRQADGKTLGVFRPGSDINASASVYDGTPMTVSMDPSASNRSDTLHQIVVRGARTHNLRNLDVDLPHGKFIVVTGPSGCGKSSLAVDTVFAEGQRQYLETLSPYARQFINELPRPDVDFMDGLLPTIRIDQHATANHPRSTVATLSEVYDYLRIVLARLGIVHCPGCGQPVRQQTLSEITQSIMRLPTGTKIMILAPLVRGRKGRHQEALEQIRRERLVRVRIDGTIYDIEQCPELNPKTAHTIEAITDRLIVRPHIESRLRESLALALRLSGRLVTVHLPESGGECGGASNRKDTDKTYSTQLSCSECDISFAELEPRTFSFNSPYGVCKDCEGLGVDTRGHTCAACGGCRVGELGRSVRLAGMSVVELSRASVRDAMAWCDALEGLVREQQAIAARPVAEMRSRLQFMERVGLGYLQLGRAIDSLSGGEFQRVRLAAALGTALTNTCFVLDEPSIGLHPRDTRRLIETLRELCACGNTLLVVEHDEAIMRAADWLIDLGPGAGPHGGRVVAVGTPAEVARGGIGATAQFLNRNTAIRRPPRQKTETTEQWLELTGASGNNLRDVTLRIPLGTLCAVTGVSGSGKSTLVNQTLVPALQRELGSAVAAGMPKPFRTLQGSDSIQRVVLIDQRPIGRSGRSCPATYCGVFDQIRHIFSATKEAKRLGFTPARFSFNSRQGACADCQGNGSKRIEMQFLPDLITPCPTCQGRRFNAQTLSVRFRGLTIADVLELTVEQACAEFSSFREIYRKLKTLEQTGLGYLRLGQPSNSLSGGEAQRLKLANELTMTVQGHTLYVLDEPTTGLHPTDVQRILDLLARLVDRGNTVIVIEHHLDLIRHADWVIDLGPDGGEAGGRIVAEGPPALIAENAMSHTGACLREWHRAQEMNGNGPLLRRPRTS